MANSSSEQSRRIIPTVEEIAEQGSWQSELHSLTTFVVFYNLVLLAQVSDDEVRAGIALRWERFLADHFATAHRDGLLVGALGTSYGSSREDRLVDPTLQVQAIWFDALNELYGANNVGPCDYCAGCGQYICPLCMRAFLCAECAEHSTHCIACSSSRHSAA